MGEGIAVRTVYPERHLELIVGQRPVHLRRVVAAHDVAARLIDLLSVVGHIDDDGVFVGKALYDLVDDGVVVETGVVVVGNHAPAAVADIWPPLGVVVGGELMAVAREAGVVAHMLADEVEDDEVVPLEVYLAVFQETVVVGQQAVVERMQLGVAHVKLCLAQRGVVEEEAAREVIHSLLGLWQELIGEERYLVACLAEQLREQWVVAPFAFLTDNMH